MVKLKIFLILIGFVSVSTNIKSQNHFTKNDKDIIINSNGTKLKIRSFAQNVIVEYSPTYFRILLEKDKDFIDIKIKDNISFFTKQQLTKLLKNEEFINKQINNIIKNDAMNILAKEIIIIDNCPTIYFETKELNKQEEKSKYTFYNIIFWEDKIFSIITNIGGNYNYLERIIAKFLYKMTISESIIIPQQYE